MRPKLKSVNVENLYNYSISGFMKLRDSGLFIPDNFKIYNEFPIIVIYRKNALPNSWLKRQYTLILYLLYKIKLLSRSY